MDITVCKTRKKRFFKKCPHKTNKHSKVKDREILKEKGFHKSVHTKQTNAARSKIAKY